MSAVNVEDPLAANLASIIIRVLTLEKGLMSVGNVENRLAKVPASFSTREFTFEKGPECSEC